MILPTTNNWIVQLHSFYCLKSLANFKEIKNEKC